MRDPRIVRSLLAFAFVLAVSGAPACSDGTSRASLGDESSSSGSSGTSGSSGSSGSSGDPDGTSSSGSSGTSSGSSGDSDAGSDGDGGGGGLNCSGENAEPNDTAAQAHSLGSIDDCDKNGGYLTSVISGTGDTDYYSYSGTDVGGCVVDPTAKVDVAGLEVCVFAQCTAGTTSLVNCLGGQAATATKGTIVGCCTLQTTPVTTSFECAGGDDSATVSMSVRYATGSSANACKAYKLDYHF